MANEIVLAENIAGAWRDRAKLMHVPKGATITRFHGRIYRDSGRIAFNDRVRVFVPVESEAGSDAGANLVRRPPLTPT